MIKSYKQFWEALSEKFLDFDRVKHLTEALLILRRQNKELFKELVDIFPCNPELELLVYTYNNFVTWEPIDRRMFKKRVKQLSKRAELMRRNPHYLDPFDENCCVIGISLSGEDHNSIILASNNTTRVFEADKALLKVVKLNHLMPHVIEKRHDAILTNYKHSQKSPYINNLTYAWGVSGRRKLFLFDVIIKILNNSAESILVSYVRAICYKKYLIVNAYGEIDTFGEYFNRMTKLDFDIYSSCPAISIFMFMPGLLLHFLPFLYDNDQFAVQGFNYQWLDTLYLFVYKDQTKLVRELSKILESRKGSREEYCNALFEVLSKISFAQIKRVFQVKVSIKEFRLQRHKPEIRFSEIMISDLYEVTEIFTTDHFSQSFIFLEKLNFTKLLRSSLASYIQRAEERNYDCDRGLDIRNRLPFANEYAQEVRREKTRQERPGQSAFEDQTLDEVEIERRRSRREHSKASGVSRSHPNWASKRQGSSEKNSLMVLGRHFEEVEELSRKRLLLIRFCRAIKPTPKETDTSLFWGTYFHQMSVRLSTKIEEKGPDIAEKLPVHFNREFFRGENLKVNKKLEVRTFYQQDSKSQEDNRLMGENHSTSMASSTASEGKDFYMGVKKRIKNNIRLQKEMLQKLRLIFLLGLGAGVILGLINSFWFVTQSVLTFSPQSRNFYYEINRDISRYFSIGFMSAFFAQASSLAKPLILPQNVTDVGALNATYQASLLQFIDGISSASADFSKYWHPTTEEFFTSLDKRSNFAFVNNISARASLHGFFKSLILVGEEYQTTNKTFAELNEILQENFFPVLRRSSDLEQELDREYSASFDFFELFQRVTTALA